MRLFGREMRGVPAALVVLVAIMLLSWGLCGVSGSIEQRHGWGWMNPGPPNSALGEAVGFLSLAGFLGVIGSGLGIGLVLLVWPILAISERVYGSSSEPDGVQRPIEKEDAVDEDDPL